MLKATRLALILGLMMGTFMATPVTAAPPKSKKTEKRKSTLKITSFDEYLRLLLKGKDKWTSQEFKDLREYAFAREKEGFEMAIKAERDYIKNNLPRALPAFPEDCPLPGSLTSSQRREERKKDEAGWQQVINDGGRLTEKEHEIICQAEALFAEKVGLYLVPKDLLTTAEIKKRSWSEDTPSILPTRAAQINQANWVGVIATSDQFRTAKVNSD